MNSQSKITASKTEETDRQEDTENHKLWEQEPRNQIFLQELLLGYKTELWLANCWRVSVNKSDRLKTPRGPSHFCEIYFQGFLQWRSEKNSLWLPSGVGKKWLFLNTPEHSVLNRRNFFAEADLLGVLSEPNQPGRREIHNSSPLSYLVTLKRVKYEKHWWSTFSGPLHPLRTYSSPIISLP